MQNWTSFFDYDSELIAVILSDTLPGSSGRWTTVSYRPNLLKVPILYLLPKEITLRLGKELQRIRKDVCEVIFAISHSQYQISTSYLHDSTLLKAR